uniref:Uncharacterized protein n=1 Tax=Timema cristinae TaxID=61476 RepID=A0A7R9DCX2_TIMCR|nr:unnamed protein product [Timema cristinae]
MPVLEDGLSSGHASDTDNNPTVLLMKRQITEIEREIVQRSSRGGGKLVVASSPEMPSVQDFLQPGKDTSTKGSLSPAEEVFTVGKSRDNSTDPELEALDPLGNAQMTPPPPAPQPHRSLSLDPPPNDSVEAAIKDIRLALQRTKTLPLKSPSSEENHEVTDSPVWVPRRRVVTNGDSDQRKGHSGEEGVEEDERQINAKHFVSEEADTDLETDRLLGQQRTDDLGFFDEKVFQDKKHQPNCSVCSILPSKCSRTGCDWLLSNIPYKEIVQEDLSLCRVKHEDQYGDSCEK